MCDTILAFSTSVGVRSILNVHVDVCGVGRGMGPKTRRRRVTMQLPPPAIRKLEPELSPEQKGPPGYKWDPNYPGTMKPGSEKDNWPLEEVLASGVYERMKYVEVDTDECKPIIHKPDEDLLEWLSKKGRLLPPDADEDDIEMEDETKVIADDELEYAEDDDKMLAYYSKQREGSAAGTSPDFGGFSESSTDDTRGF